jgi:hypothetical protein
MFMLWNEEDSIPASPDLFRTEAEAREYARAFRARYERQGYYLAADWRRIAPKDIRLVVLAAEP